MNLASRTISSIGWKSGSNILRVLILFVRSIILARVLPIEVFGIYAGALAVVTITAVLFNFGLGGAFLFISNQEVDENRAAAAHFTLNILFKSAWVICLVVFATLFMDGPARLALVVLTLANFLSMSTDTPQLVLAGRVVHRRLALTEVIVEICSTIAVVALALFGAGLWALLSTNIVAGLVSIIFLYGHRPVWKPRLIFSTTLFRRFLDFGWRNVWADLLQVLLNKLDVLWTATFLGAWSMGLYSRALTFATYPRKLIAAPVNSVSLGLYAKLAGDRLKLSRAFFRINALLVRAGFLLAGMLALIAPEFVHLVIGDKWLPFLDPFRLLLLFALLDPIKLTLGHLFVAVGEPGQAARIRFIQLLVLVAGLIGLGLNWGITGVAVAVDIMLLVGIGLFLWHARAYVDFSVRRLFQAPLIALTVAGVSVFLALDFLPGNVSYWHSAAVKLMAFAPVYIALLLALEWSEMKNMAGFFNIQRKRS